MLLIVFTISMFASATLLFLVEPMIAKMLLPLLGGTPAVWNTCMVFFQFMLLAGYLYAYAAMRWVGRRTQIVIHLGMVMIPMLVLPLHLPAGWEPPTQSSPVFWLLGVLAVSVGLPFLVLASSTPVLQRWFGSSGHAQASDPYFLYAASNVGSLAGLMAYPFVMEPMLRLSEQSRIWRWGYLGFRALHCRLRCAGLEREDEICTSGNRRYFRSGRNRAVEAAASLDCIGICAFEPDDRRHDRAHDRRSGDSAVLGDAAGALPDQLYLRICETAGDPAGVDDPAVAVSHPGCAGAGGFADQAAAGCDACAVSVRAVWRGDDVPRGACTEQAAGGAAYRVLSLDLGRRSDRGRVQLAGCAAGLSFGARISARADCRRAAEATDRCEANRGSATALGEAEGLAIADRARPCHADRDFGGGAAGLQAEQAAEHTSFRLCDAVVPDLWKEAAAVCCRCGGTVHCQHVLSRIIWGYLAYGAELLRRVAGDERSGREVPATLSWGTIHGIQSLDATRSKEPLAYFTRKGPAGDIFRTEQSRIPNGNVAVVGLGAGAMACHMKPGETLTYYEIDPSVTRIAEDPRYFTFLSHCAPQAKVVLGDARLKLRDAPDGRYGLIVLDAFSGDSIPMHLVTREALALYKRKLAPGGMLAFHISNLYLELGPTLAALADDGGMVSLVADDSDVSAREIADGKFPSRWMVMARSEKDLGNLQISSTLPGRWIRPHLKAAMRVWSDDYSNMLGIIKWH